MNGLTIAYEIIGEASDGGRTWIITPGGRFGMDYGGVRQLGEAIAAGGNRAIIWDRPNTGASDVCFLGPSESQVQADALAIWWISGGTLGLIGLGFHYCSPSIRAAWNGGMEAVDEALPNARLVGPPWGDREWMERQAARNRGEGDLFDGWPQLAPQLLSWADDVLD